MLLLTAFIWGSAFVAQSAGMDSVEAFTYNGVRILYGLAVLIPFILIRDRIEGKKMTAEQKEKRRQLDKKTWIVGIPIGLTLCVATNFQQYAFSYPDHSPGKIAFITAMYMLLVPVFGLFIKKKVPLPTWGCVALGCVGLYLLSIGPGGFSAVTKSDVLAMVCSVFFALHILLIEKLGDECDSIKLSCVQFIVTGVITCILMLIFEHPTAEGLKGALIPMLYSGVLSCGVAYTLQIVGPKYTESTLASMILCLESVFGVLCSAWLLPDKNLTGREILGCALMFVAIIAAQLAEVRHQKRTLTENVL